MLDDTTPAFPSYDGNGMFLWMGDVTETNGVGSLFIDFETKLRMGVDGTCDVLPEHGPARRG